MWQRTLVRLGPNQIEPDKTMGVLVIGGGEIARCESTKLECMVMLRNEDKVDMWS